MKSYFPHDISSRLFRVTSEKGCDVMNNSYILLHKHHGHLPFMYL